MVKTSSGAFKTPKGNVNGHSPDSTLDLKSTLVVGMLMQPQERFEAVLQGARNLIDSGESMESALKYVRSAELSQIERVKVVKSLMGGNLGQQTTRN